MKTSQLATNVRLMTDFDLKEIIHDCLKSFFEEQENNKEREAEKDDVLLTEKEVCERLGVTHATLWNWNKKKYLCHVKIGHRVRWRESDITRLLEGRI